MIDPPVPDATRHQPRRRVAVFSGNRADYGQLYPILRALAADERLELLLIVSGAHLDDAFGRTLDEIEAHGFHVAAKVRLENTGRTLYANARAIGSGIVQLTDVLSDLRPDVLLIYADRFETLAAGVAGTQMGIPTAHVEGGDYTEGGSLDDSVRHALTKLAHLHFTTNEQSAARVRRMGEESWRIFSIGLPVLDLVASGEYSSPRDVRSRFRLDSGRPLLVFTQHSVATEFMMAGEQVRPSLNAFAEAARRWSCQVVMTYPNDDAGGHLIIEELRAFVAKSSTFARLQPSAGRADYHGLLHIAAACVGNSSSGIKETPAFRCPCVNIGTRQLGRLRAANVLDVGYDAGEIVEAIDRCLHDPLFRETVRTSENPYGAGNSGQRLAEVLATIPIDGNLLRKRMTY